MQTSGCGILSGAHLAAWSAVTQYARVQIGMASGGMTYELLMFSQTKGHHLLIKHSNPPDKKTTPVLPQTPETSPPLVPSATQDLDFQFHPKGCQFHWTFYTTKSFVTMSFHHDRSTKASESYMWFGNWPFVTYHITGLLEIRRRENIGDNRDRDHN